MWITSEEQKMRRTFYELLESQNINITEEYIQSLSNNELENWYDKADDMALAVIIASVCVPVQDELAELKKNYKWKT